MLGSDFIEHPEGGRYRDVYRSATVVRAPDQADRRALTHIYFSLRSGEMSRFHRLRNDEVWSLYQGEGIRLILWDGGSRTVEAVELSASSGQYCHAVPARCWQAAVPLCGTVLLGCTVAPGFEYDDFELMDPRSPVAEALLRHRPDLERLVRG
jgi:predicted cupin superfamily sugar epimerase